MFKTWSPTFSSNAYVAIKYVKKKEFNITYLVFQVFDILFEF